MSRPACNVLILLLFTPLLTAANPPPSSLALGTALYFDTNLSLHRNISCADCHAPGVAFVDPRSNNTGRAVSSGTVPAQLGRRHTPTLSYIGINPGFGPRADRVLRGGFFYDGRATTLAEQAQGPLFSPLEMGISKSLLKTRLAENENYLSLIRALLGPEPWTQDALVALVSDSLAVFQRSAMFQPFDSKFDRYLRGESKLTPLEEQGRVLFFSTLVNCNSCHMLERGREETFSDYTFHNIGVPTNPLLSHLQQPDLGLGEHPNVTDAAQRGKFKVPTLRNVAVTAPYMHNGVFKELRTVMAFYNKFILVDPINPETGQPWRPPEVPQNISHDLLRQGQPLNPERMDAIIAFLRTLTDARYEHLLDPSGKN